VSRTVAIAGAGGALGPHVVRAFREAGWRVSAAERDAGRLEGCSEADDKYAVDLLDPEAARGWAAHVGEVDAVAHLVGGWRGGQKIDEAPPEDAEWLHDLLVRTVQNVTRAFLPALRASGGRFGLVSSAQAQDPDAGNAAYAAAKAAAETWTLAVGADLAEHGGTANVLVVNAIVTPEMRAAEPDKAFKAFTDAEEIAAGLVYLFSDAARKMNRKRLSLHP
jgi:NAD(P)-dependent dehydrogenase (short-subunit alcohol dehydrogenase family)